MKDFILMMHGRTVTQPTELEWSGYLESLRASGCFSGGSSVGAGRAFRKGGEAGPTSDAITGYLRVKAADLDAAAAWLRGNPVYEAGGIVEIRELPED